MEILRLRSSRRVLIALLEAETARRMGMEAEIGRLRHLLARIRLVKPRS